MSSALWIPLLWVLMYSTRPIARWLGGGEGGGDEGGRIDPIVQFFLIASAIVVLNRRRFAWGSLTSLNAAFFLFFAYFAVSIVWSDYPFTAFKRLVKEFGNVLIVLVVLTEADPAGALKTIGFRCAAICFPLSEVLIRWFPHLGREYSKGGFATATGVTTQKNSLGQICAVLSFILLWDLVDNFRNRKLGQPVKFFSSSLVLFVFGLVLLFQSQSKTSMLALFVGMAIFFATKASFVRRSPVVYARSVFLLVAFSLIVTAVWTTQVAPLLEAIGGDPTFTERTRTWEAVLRQDINPLVGCGFFSFWLEKGPAVWEEFVNFNMNTAHDGYLEMYLDGGFIACALLGVFLIFTSWRLAGQFSCENSYTRALFAIVMMTLIFNFSETCFFRLCLVWFCLVLAALASHPFLLPKVDPVIEISAEEPSEPLSHAG
jgi:exopolysaccharide production protein ExoQ